MSWGVSDEPSIGMARRGKRANFGDAVGQRVASEIENSEEPICRRDQVRGKDVELDLGPQDCGGK